MKRRFFLLIFLFVFCSVSYGVDPISLSPDREGKIRIVESRSTPEAPAKFHLYETLFNKLAENNGYRKNITVIFDRSLKKSREKDDLYEIFYRRFSYATDENVNTSRRKRLAQKDRYRWFDSFDRATERKRNSCTVSDFSLIVRRDREEGGVEPMLKLADYAMKNARKIRKIPSDTLTETSFGQARRVLGVSWEPETITKQISKKVKPEQIAEILESPLSAEALDAFGTRVVRNAADWGAPEGDHESLVSYHWQEGKYYIYLREDMGKDVEPLFVWGDVYSIQHIPEAGVTLLFPDAKTFYCVRNRIVSQKQENSDPDFIPWYGYHPMELIGTDTISMKYYRKHPNWIPGKPVSMRYVISEDRVIPAEMALEEKNK